MQLTFKEPPFEPEVVKYLIAGKVLTKMTAYNWSRSRDLMVYMLHNIQIPPLTVAVKVLILPIKRETNCYCLF